MRWRALAGLILPCALVVGMPCAAQTAADAVAAPAVSTLRQTLMGRALVMQGELDGRRIELVVEPKKNEDGLKGRYIVVGEGTDILLAGEVDGDDLVMEESRNGRDVSGQWEGRRQGAVIVGTWSDPTGAVSRPFSLQLP